VTDRPPTSTGRFRGLHYGQYGRGRPVIALHGFGETAYSWRHLTAALPDGLALYAFDLRGCGSSAKPHDEHYTLREQADEICAFIEECDLVQTSLIGHSLGGGIALLVALGLLARERRPHSLVLIDSIAFPQPLPWFMRLLRTPVLGPSVLALLPPAMMVRAVMSWAFHDPRKIDEEAVRNYAQNLSSPEGRYAQLQIANNIIPNDIDGIVARYHTIDVPTLIAWGANDRIVPVTHGTKLHMTLPQSRLLTVPACGHLPHEERPCETIPAICTFLANPAGG
jgi:pimeloyl-ACP methyl ester carboxylesterase